MTHNVPNILIKRHMTPTVVLPYGYSYKASFLYFLTSGHSHALSVRVPRCQKIQMTT